MKLTNPTVADIARACEIPVGEEVAHAKPIGTRATSIHGIKLSFILGKASFGDPDFSGNFSMPVRLEMRWAPQNTGSVLENAIRVSLGKAAPQSGLPYHFEFDPEAVREKYRKALRRAQDGAAGAISGEALARLHQALSGDPVAWRDRFIDHLSKTDSPSKLNRIREVLAQSGIEI